MEKKGKHFCGSLLYSKRSLDEKVTDLFHNLLLWEIFEAVEGTLQSHAVQT